jgi:hypothetical protein
LNDPECIYDSKSGFGLLQVASGVWVFVALVLRNPSHVGQFVPTCKIGISP